MNDIVNVSDLAELIMFADDTNVFRNNKSLEDLTKQVNMPILYRYIGRV